MTDIWGMSDKQDPSGDCTSTSAMVSKTVQGGLVVGLSIIEYEGCRG